MKCPCPGWPAASTVTRTSSSPTRPRPSARASRGWVDQCRTAGSDLVGWDRQLRGERKPHDLYWGFARVDGVHQPVCISPARWRQAEERPQWLTRGVAAQLLLLQHGAH
eukprot:638193-Rhodomonas_salina.4